MKIKSNSLDLNPQRIVHESNYLIRASNNDVPRSTIFYETNPTKRSSVKQKSRIAFLKIIKMLLFLHYLCHSVIHLKVIC
jgi:hypothetical protein